VLADGAVNVSGGGIGNGLNVKPGKLANGIAYAPNVNREFNTDIVIDRNREEPDVPSLGSATARDTFFSSLIESSKLARRGVTFPSIMADTSSRAVVALSNFWKFFNFSL
jgi:hypothetical protein